MSALDNVLVGMHSRLKSNALDAVLRTPRFHREEKMARERGLDLLRFVGLAGKHEEWARNLAVRRSAPAGSGARAGHRATLAVARRADGRA